MHLWTYAREGNEALPRSGRPNEKAEVAACRLERYGDLASPWPSPVGLTFCFAAPRSGGCAGATRYR